MYNVPFIPPPRDNRKNPFRLATPLRDHFFYNNITLGGGDRCRKYSTAAESKVAATCCHRATAQSFDTLPKRVSARLLVAAAGPLRGHAAPTASESFSILKRELTNGLCVLAKYYAMAFYSSKWRFLLTSWFQSVLNLSPLTNTMEALPVEACETDFVTDSFAKSEQRKRRRGLNHTDRGREKRCTSSTFRRNSSAKAGVGPCPKFDEARWTFNKLPCMRALLEGAGGEEGRLRLIYRSHQHCLVTLVLAGILFCAGGKAGLIKCTQKHSTPALSPLKPAKENMRSGKVWMEKCRLLELDELRHRRLRRRCCRCCTAV